MAKQKKKVPPKKQEQDWDCDEFQKEQQKKDKNKGKSSSQEMTSPNCPECKSSGDDLYVADKVKKWVKVGLYVVLLLIVIFIAIIIYVLLTGGWQEFVDYIADKFPDIGGGG